MLRDEIDDYGDALARMSDDPDNVQDADRVLLARYAAQGAMIGLRHGGPRFISVDAEFMRKASSC